MKTDAKTPALTLEIVTDARDQLGGRRADIVKILDALNVVSDTAFDSVYLTAEDRAAVELSHRAPTWLALNEIRLRLDAEIKVLESQIDALNSADEAA